MSELIKLPKEVAEAIEKVWEVHGEGHIKHFTLTNWSYLHSEYPIGAKFLQKYAELHPIEYMTALVNGYEVEETPEDKVKAYYSKLMEIANRQDSDKYVVNHWRRQAQVMLDTLNMLNIKIEGVNV